MALHKEKRGLTLPITGKPAQRVGECAEVTKIAILAKDYVGLKPALKVKVGDLVKRGSLLFTDKIYPAIQFTAPGAGTVCAINRGERRALQSVVIKLNKSEVIGTPARTDFLKFSSFQRKTLSDLSRNDVKDLLLESGLWTSLRTRPFGYIARPEAVPHSIFVTAIDTDPLAPTPSVALRGNDSHFHTGLECLAKLTPGKVFVCTGAKDKITTPVRGRIVVEEFQGPHPSGLVGYHIHTLDPVSRNKFVWHINYQDVVSIGKLFVSGKLDSERIIALAGPGTSNPRLIKTRVGACVSELTSAELKEGEQRLISGSIFSGDTVADDILGYLGRYHTQISVLPEDREREFIGWMLPGKDKFSVIPAFLSGFLKKKEFNFTTNTYGAPRAIVPIGMYEKVMPMDILPTFLLRSLMARDLDSIEKLGGLELEEEDLGLCTFVCPSKIEFGPVLRENLNELLKEME